jgi:MFS family permease
MLFSLAAGAIADNYEKRAVMLVAQTFLIVVSVLLVGCTYFGLITPWSLLIFTFLIGCGTALNNPKPLLDIVHGSRRARRTPAEKACDFPPRPGSPSRSRWWRHQL